MVQTQHHVAKVTQLVYDFMTIELNEVTMPALNAGYKIYNSFNRLIRQGSFSGTAVQLRVSHLDKGDYFIRLCVNEEELGCYQFSKLCN